MLVVMEHAAENKDVVVMEKPVFMIFTQLWNRIFNRDKKHIWKWRMEKIPIAENYLEFATVFAFHKKSFWNRKLTEFYLRIEV